MTDTSARRGRSTPRDERTRSGGWLPSLCSIALLAWIAGCGNNAGGNANVAVAATTLDAAVDTHAQTLIDEGRQTFRFDTFGDEAFWGDTLHLHQAIAGSAHGGVGAGLSP